MASVNAAECAIPVLRPVQARATIDLDRDEGTRWNAVLENATDRGHVHKFISAAYQVTKERAGGAIVVALVSRLAYLLGYKRRGIYIGESDAIAAGLAIPGVNPATISVMQRIYTLAHVGAGCSAAVVAGGADARQMRLVRSMDWETPAVELGDATRLIDFKRGGRTVFPPVNALGMCGVLSAVKKGVGAVTLNWAQSGEMPRRFRDPTFRLREVMEEDGCNSFRELVARLSGMKLGAPVFYTVCGLNPDEAVILEYSGPKADRWSQRKPEAPGKPLVQTNHYVNMKELNHPEPSVMAPEKAACVPLIESSATRKKIFEEALAAIPSIDRVDPQVLFRDALSRLPVRNQYSRQQMVLDPATGGVSAWAHQS